ncbi:MAG: glutaredoxin family protein [Steroidobacteraceae bacterium]|nr:glutaredoxin family protein [Steroidobacteraceae bacterium]MDW8259084.1 glutaredoxin family protein [Gammaproteobacteria bacterium]
MDLVLLTRADCELCATMRDELESLLEAWRWPPPRLLDVDADRDLQRRFGLKVPVLLADGALICQGRLDRVAVTRLLQRSSRV